MFGGDSKAYFQKYSYCHSKLGSRLSLKLLKEFFNLLSIYQIDGILFSPHKDPFRGKKDTFLKSNKIFHGNNVKKLLKVVMEIIVKYYFQNN